MVYTIKCGTHKRGRMTYQEIRKMFYDFFVKNMKSPNIVFALQNEFHIIPELLIDDIEATTIFKIQSFLNSLYLKDIKKIIKRSDENNIFLVFMKGIFYAADLYENYNYRITNDLDLLTTKDDLYNLDFCLRSIGYSCGSDENLLERSEKGHLKYTKSIGRFGRLLVEVHTSVCYPVKCYRGYTDYVLTKVGRQKYLNLEPRMVSPQDRLVHSCLHFFKHAKDAFSHKIMKFPFIIKWQILFDIVLLVNKYGFDENYVYYIAKIHKCSLDLYIPLKIINYIIPGFMDEKIVLSLQNMGLESEILKNSWEKQAIIDCLDKGQLSKKIIEYISFDYSNVMFLSKRYQNIVSYTGEDYRVNIELMLTEKQFVFLVSCENVDLICSSLLIHYSSLNEANDIILEKIVCSFKTENGILCSMVDMPYNNNYTNEIQATCYKQRNKYLCRYTTSKQRILEAIKKSPNEILSFSVTLGGKDECLSGEAWNDFASMKHIKV